MVKDKNKESDNENKVEKLKKLKRPLKDVENNIKKSKKRKKQFDLPDVNKNNDNVDNKPNWFVALNPKNIDDIKEETFDLPEDENISSTELCDVKVKIESDNSTTLCDVKVVNSPPKNLNKNEIKSKNYKSKVNNDAETTNNDNIKNEKFVTIKLQQIPVSNEFTSSDESTDTEDEKRPKIKKPISKNTSDSSDQESDQESYQVVSRSVQTQFSSDNSDTDNSVKVENENTSLIPAKNCFKPFIFDKNKIPKPAIADVLYSDEDDLDEESKICELTEEEAMKLRRMSIKLAHKPPKQHCIEKHAGSTTLTPIEREKFHQYAKLKRGSFVPEEDDILKNNWQDFCSLNDWNPNNVKPFLNLRHNYGYYIPCLEERKKFLRFLGRGLDNRSLYSIFRRFKVLYEKLKVSRYSSQEDAFIIKCLKNSMKRNICSMIAAELKRSNQSVWRRIRLLQANGNELPRRKSNELN